jgi:hypothetical protein
MSNITLFDAAQDVREALAKVDDNGEIDEAYGQSLDLFKAKAVACVAYEREEFAALVAMESAVRGITERLAARKARYERFRDYIRNCMAMTGTEKVEHEHGLFKATLQRGRDEAVEIDDGAEFPPELCNPPKPPTASKVLIKAAILRGEPVAGARIVRRDRLFIK